MPALPSIQTPIEFAQWKHTGALFDAALPATETYVIDGADVGVRHAYGRSPEGFWFFIAMTPAEETEFWQIYLTWRSGIGSGAHVFAASIGTKPPTCGTPNTPPCPCVVPLPTTVSGQLVARAA